MSDLNVAPRPSDAQLVELRSWGATHRQIAAMLGLRHNTVSVRLSRIDRAARQNHPARNQEEPGDMSG